MDQEGGSQIYQFSQGQLKFVLVNTKIKKNSQD